MKRAFPSEALAGNEVNGAGRQAVVRRVIFSLLFSLLLAASVSAAKSRKKTENPALPVVSIPVEALGYQPPGDLPAYYFHAMVGVYFLDASHLLFTFERKGLLRRDDSCPVADSERMVRAVVLDVPSGKIEKQADWELYDSDDYIWSLGNGQFLVRRCSQLDRIGADLILHPWIQAAGEIMDINLSPDRSILVVEEKPLVQNGSWRPHAPGEPAEDAIEVRFVRLDPPRVIALSHVPVPGWIPVTKEGVLEALNGQNNRWIVDIQPYQEKTQRDIVSISSACRPRLAPLTNDVFVAYVCATTGDRTFVGYDVNGALLWRTPVSDDLHYPRFLRSKDGTHFAIESLHGTREFAVLDPITSKVVDAEIIDLYDTRTGVAIGSVRTTPVYTAGRNADFSPDGTRLAVLHNGAIEIYTLSSLGKK